MSNAAGYAAFPTAIGSCVIAWGDDGIVATALPDAQGSTPHAHLRRRASGAPEATPPPAVQQAIALMQRLLRGERVALTHIVLDMAGAEPFHRKVWEASRGIAPGQTLTYGEVAALLGDPGSARAVGQALGANPFPLIVPCHRVLAARSQAGGFSAPGGTRTKLRLLEIEGAAFGSAPGLFDA